MGASSVPFVIFTLFWLLVGGVAPWFVPKGINRGVIQTMLVLTAVCCYLFWLCCYMAQMNPLFGPQLTPEVLAVMRESWKKCTMKIFFHLLGFVIGNHFFIFDQSCPI